VSTSTTHEAAGTGMADLTPGIVRYSPVQTTRRAVLHVHAPGDAPVPADLASWFNERGFHFYVAGVRMPLAAALSARHASRDMRSALTDLDAAYGCLRQADGMVSVVVTAQGRAAVAAALWTGRRPDRDSRRAMDSHEESDGQAARADAVILWAPAWPARGGLHLDIACPVLVIGGKSDAGAGGRLRARGSRPWRLSRSGAPTMQLGSHVTWLALADACTERRLFLTELGRWLGAYMYGPERGQLL
jgi:hypothetical protein